MPRRSRSVTVAAAARATNGSSVRRYSSGSSGPPGHGVRRLVGMWVCSVTQSDSKPRSSISVARRSGRIERSVGKIRAPMCIAADRTVTAGDHRRPDAPTSRRQQPCGASTGCRAVPDRSLGACPPDGGRARWRVKAPWRHVCASVVRDRNGSGGRRSSRGWSAVQSGGERSVCSANLMLSVPPIALGSDGRPACEPVASHDPPERGWGQGSGRVSPARADRGRR